MSYCGKECQTADWKAWHWGECKRCPVSTVNGEPLVGDRSLINGPGKAMLVDPRLTPA